MATTYIGLLRGINVGKAKRVAMADLRALLEALGFENVRTLLNSGNVVFSSAKAVPVTELATHIETAFEKEFGFRSRLTILSAEELAQVVEENPLGEIAKEPSRYMIAFMTDASDVKKLGPLSEKDWKPEALAVGKRVAYVWCPEGVLTSPAFDAVGRALGDGVTTRNWATVTKLLALTYRDPSTADQKS
jgi:uncharacterized protein (DUF1697 family)